MKPIKKLVNATGVAVSPDKSRFLLYHGKAVLYNAKDYSEVGNFKALSNTISSAISYDNSKLVFKNTSGKIALWDINSCTLIKSFTMNKKEGTNCLFTPDNKYVVDADWDGNVMLVDISRLKHEVIKTYDGCMIQGIDFKKDTNEFIFSFKEKSYYPKNELDDRFVIIWKYPFEENEPVKYIMPEEVHRFSAVKHIPNSEGYFSLREKNLVILDKSFVVKEIAPLKLDLGFKPVVCSENGSYLATIKHGVNLYSLKNYELIESYFTKGSSDVCFLKGDRYLILAARSGSYVLEL